MPRRAVRPKGHKRTPAWWVALQQLIRPVQRGYAQAEPASVETLQREAIEGRKLMETMK